MVQGVGFAARANASPGKEASKKKRSGTIGFQLLRDRMEASSSKGSPSKIEVIAVACCLVKPSKT